MTGVLTVALPIGGRGGEGGGRERGREGGRGREREGGRESEWMDGVEEKDKRIYCITNVPEHILHPFIEK